MKSMTVRGIDPALAERLSRAAREQGKSVNQLVIETIQKSFGMDKEKRFTRTFNDLDDLFGRWTQDEFEAIQGSIDGQRTIDEEIWR